MVFSFRSIEGEFVMNVETEQGIPLWRYGSPFSYAANATITPDNIGFCTPQDHCLGTGVVNVTECQIGKHLPDIIFLVCLAFCPSYDNSAADDFEHIL